MKLNIKKTDRIDEYIGAKLQACALNYNRELVKMFGKSIVSEII